MAIAVHTACMVAGLFLLHELYPVLLVFTVVVLAPSMGMMVVVIMKFVVVVTIVVVTMVVVTMVRPLPNTPHFRACTVAHEISRTTFSVALKGLVQHHAGANQLLCRMWALKMAKPVFRLASLMTCNGFLEFFSHFWALWPWATFMALLSQMLRQTMSVAICDGHNFLTFSFQSLPRFRTLFVACLISTTLLVTISDHHHSCTHCIVEALQAPIRCVLPIMEIPMVIMVFFLELGFMMLFAVFMDMAANMTHCLSDQVIAIWQSMPMQEFCQTPRAKQGNQEL